MIPLLIRRILAQPPRRGVLVTEVSSPACVLVVGVLFKQYLSVHHSTPHHPPQPQVVFVRLLGRNRKNVCCVTERANNSCNELNQLLKLAVFLNNYVASGTGRALVIHYGVS
jgi:hypothetical protein